MTEAVAAPAERFNYADYLFQLNRDRAAKTAYIDDGGELTYGELDDASRRLARALLDAGIRREERVLLLMHDNNDWPVAFLGTLFAGIVPVAVNTLLTADDYAYMLRHCRARQQGPILSAKAFHPPRFRQPPGRPRRRSPRSTSRPGWITSN